MTGDAFSSHNPQEVLGQMDVCVAVCAYLFCLVGPQGDGCQNDKDGEDSVCLTAERPRVRDTESESKRDRG